ncbi:MAG: hypothetical protein ACI4XN_04305 [Candidatus Kurthia intestinigallinarum]
MKPLRPQKYIFKLNSTYLDMNNYDVHIELNDVALNSEIVISVGHSQLIKWIEELTGTENNYIKAENKRKEIKGLKQLGNTRENKKNIKEKYDELYNLQFEPNLVSIQFDKKAHFDKCCQNLIINGKHFHRLYGTPGGLKMSTVLFISSDLYFPIHERINNGRNLSLEYTPAKLEAYFALTSSTSNKVSWPNMIVVKGTVTNFKSDVIEVSDGINSNDPIVKDVKDKDIEIEINDGCGLMMPEYSRKINYEATGNDEIASGVCARCAFLKGMLFTFDFKEFAKDIAHKSIVIDAWGHERNVMDADVIVTTSQLKLWDAYDSYESYRENCEKYGYDFRLTKISDDLDESRNLNYQFTQSYYLDDEDIEELISPTVDEIKDIISLDPRKSIVYLAGAGLNDKNVMKSDNIAKALMINKELINDPYIRSRIERMIQKKIRLAKISTIDVVGNFALISGDPYAMCEDIFGMNVRGLLDAGELYHKFWQDKDVKEVVCMRAPMCAHFNIVKQKIKYSDKADYWFRYIKDCIILNSWDTLRNAESGCDCDGDILFTTNNKVLVNKYRPLPALDCQQHKAPKMLPTEDNIAASNKRGFKNKVGSITNIGTSMLNLQSKFPIGSPEWNELEYRVICIQHFQQLSIDSVKGIRMIPMNNQWNNLSQCLPSDKDDEKTAAIKEFNKKICAYRKPFFFIYRYNTTKSEYDRYVKNVNSKLQLKYHITLDELLNADNLTEELHAEREHFYNRCPVDMSHGTVNRIAWAVNKKFESFESLPVVNFDKEIIKSGVLYDKSDAYKIRDIYKEYKNSIVNLTKKTKSDEIDEDEEQDGVLDKSVIDLIFRGKFYEACPNEKMLCDILIDLLYDNPNSKGVVWDMCGDVIIDNLLSKSGGIIEYPEQVHENEEFGCCRKKFKMKHIVVGGDNYGEI